MFYEPIYLDIDLSSFQPSARQMKNLDFKRINCQPEHCKPEMCGPDNCQPRNYQPGHSRICQSSKCPDQRSLHVKLPEFQPENIHVKINKFSGRVNINASKDNTRDTGRNGQRKTTVHADYSFDLPEYLVKECMLNKIKTEFISGKLFFEFPPKPVGVKMTINFEDGEDKCLRKNNDGKKSDIVRSMVDDIEEQCEQEMIDFEIVKINDADGNSEIDVE